MNKSNISFIVSGKNAGIGAEEIKKIIKEEFESDIQIAQEKESCREDQTKEIDPISIGALILAIPGAILTFAQLSDRIKKKEKLDRTLDKIRKQVSYNKKVTVKIKYPNGMIKEISTVDSVEILDNISVIG